MQILPNAKVQFIDQNGLPLASGTVGFYFPGTLNPKPTYQDAAGTIANTNPVALDSRGQALIWGSGVYRQIVKDASGVTIWDQVTEDSNAGLTGNLTDAKFVSGTDFTPGTTTQLTLPAAPGSTSNMWAHFDASFQASDQFSVNGTVVTFNSPIPVGVQEVNIKFGTTIAIGTPGSGTVTDASVASGTRLYNRLNDFIDLRDKGCKCDGVTDDTAALQMAITSIGSTGATLIIPGPTLVSAAVTFNPNTQLFPINGGYLIGKAGTEVVQIQSAPLAGPVKLFLNMASRCTNGMTVYPEWFGAAADGVTDDAAAIQSAIAFIKNTGGVVQFEARPYFLSTFVNIGTATDGSSAGQNTVLQGKGRHSTILKCSDANQGMFQILGSSTVLLQGIAIRDLTITKSATATGGIGIFSEYTAGLHLENIQIDNFLQGVGLLRATNTMAEKVTVSFSGATNGWVGFNLDGGGTGSGGNASTVLRDCYVDGSTATGTGSTGFKAFGAYVSDLLFEACETQRCSVGYAFDMSASVNTGNEDVQLINCRADSISVAGVSVNGAGGSGSPDSMLTIIGGWFNSLSTLSEVDLILLQNSQGVVIQNAQLYGAAGAANLYQVKMVNCSGCSVLGNTFREFKYGVFSTGGRANRVSDNNFYSGSAGSAIQHIAAVNEAYSSFDDNTFRGYATNAIAIDSSCTSISSSGNNADPATIGSPRFSNAAGGTSYNVNNIGA
ncbi:hypothetical protein LMG28727_04859 [Paraburkholderia kirstenboschensis]|uniref:glycosyl hydrolase family 28-related protein n=1 Tax=Paraburkholderia kirstenboschensis TaxID=1245436 RepID=UPI000A630091|nr:glycosyl hydrolase family 28-related protein [Paraburkholderia kirstenboschensis]CAD6548595.1 hypothetical protein LMG28727_04859 [Paraburkholderia kirstenboschensis]